MDKIYNIHNHFIFYFFRPKMLKKKIKKKTYFHQ